MDDVGVVVDIVVVVVFEDEETSVLFRSSSAPSMIDKSIIEACT